MRTTPSWNSAALKSPFFVEKAGASAEQAAVMAAGDQLLRPRLVLRVEQHVAAERVRNREILARPRSAPSVAEGVETTGIAVESGTPRAPTADRASDRRAMASGLALSTALTTMRLSDSARCSAVACPRQRYATRAPASAQRERLAF
jgi:hypothetical protein